MKKSNVRHLTTALAATSFLASPSSHALGIGDMKLHSALNQNLQAEIALILSEDEKAVDFKVGLAPNTKFDEAGIPWTLFLSKIKFQTVTQNGKTFIKLTSTDVLKEPFLDFLLEVKSAKGSLYREFTVLIDPPAVYAVNEKSPPAPAQAELPQRFVLAPSEITTQESDYGPTRQDETLWSIAAQFNKQNNVSVDRMLAAIYIANPQAFSSKKTNSLIVGKMLKIPSFSKSPSLFTKTEHEHHVQPKPVTPKSVRIAKTLQHEKPAKSEPVTSEPIAMQQKMTELEKQLAAMKKTLEEKDAQINASKSIVTPAKTESSTPAVTVTTPPVIPTVSPVVQAILPPPVPKPSEPVFVTPTPTQPVAVLPPPSSQPVMTPPVVTPPVVTPSPVTMPQVTTPAPVITTTFGNYFNLPSDLYYYIAGGVGSLLLGLLAWLRLREQNKTIEVLANQDIEITQEETDDITTTDNKIEDSSAVMLDDVATMDNSEFEEFDISEFNSFMNNDSDKHNVNDILYKADVYCAYGNSEQAEKLLHEEFIRDPQAHSYALRLLKLYVEQDNKTEFKNFVSELATLGKNDLPDFWSQVSDMAATFYPEALLFTPPAISNPLTSTPFDEMFTNINLDKKFDDNPGFDSMHFENSDNKEITFGELSAEETLSSADVTDLFATPAAIPVATSSMDKLFADNSLDFNAMGFEDADNTEITFGELSAEETLSSADVTDLFATPAAIPVATSSMDKLFTDNSLDFNAMGFEDADNTEITFGELSAEETLSSADVTDLFATPAAIPVATSAMDKLFADNSLDFNAMGFEDADNTEITFGELSAEETLSSTNVTDLFATPAAIPVATSAMDKLFTDNSLDFNAMGFEDTESSAKEATNFFGELSNNTPITFEFDKVSTEDKIPNDENDENDEKEEIVLDFGHFEIDAPLETPSPVFEISTEDLDFSAFNTETKPEPVTELDLDFNAFNVNELENKTSLDLPETKPIQEPELVMVDFPFEKQDAPPFKQSFSFENTSDLIEENGMRPYLDLTKVPENEDEHLEYLDMSDSQFAELLVAEMLQKHKIKERLCRQKIVQEVLNKLS